MPQLPAYGCSREFKAHLRAACEYRHLIHIIDAPFWMRFIVFKEIILYIMITYLPLAACSVIDGMSVLVSKLQGFELTGDLHVNQPH